MPESRRDAAQEVFLAAFRGLDGFQIPQRFRTWLRGIVAGLPDGWMLVFALRHHEGWCNERGLGPRQDVHAWEAVFVRQADTLEGRAPQAEADRERKQP